MSPREILLALMAVVALMVLGAALAVARLLRQSSSPAPTGPPRLRRRCERYRLRKLLGRGGSSEVYEAWDGMERRRVALKVARDVLLADEELVRRFREEADRLARVAQAVPSGGVAELLREGRDAATGRPFLALKAVPGAALSELLRRGWRPGMSDAIAILQAVADALDALHANGLAHRDVAPDNLVVLRRGRQMAGVTLVDFGPPRHTYMSHAALGGGPLDKASYLAPEQWRGAAGDARSDVYGFGVLTWHLLVGEPPFHSAAHDPLELMDQHCGAAVPDPATTLPAELRQLMRRALAKHPADRPASAGEVAAALAAHGSAEAVAARARQRAAAEQVAAALAGSLRDEGPLRPRRRRRRIWPRLILLVLLLAAATAAAWRLGWLARLGAMTRAVWPSGE